jgi:ketosteroid isomerase-like protein
MMVNCGAALSHLRASNSNLEDKGESMSNLESVRGLYEAFARGDVPSVLSSLDANIAWTEAEGSPYGGTYNGPSAVLEGVFMQLDSEWDGFAAVPDEFIDAGDTIVVLGQYSGSYKATSKSFKANFAHVWKVREGKAIRFVQYVDTLLIYQALQA